MYKYEEVSFEDINLNNNKVLLLVTATNLETKYVHENLKLYDNYNSILKFYQGDNTYYLGIFGSYLAVHAQCGTGQFYCVNSY